MCWAALVVLLLTGWLAPISVLMHQLESRYPPPPASTNLAQYKGVIVLGGAIEDSGYWEVPGRIALRAEGERMIVPVALMQRNPHLTMLFTGGDDNVSPGRLTEADRAKIFFDLLGVDASRVIYESKSRTTYENGLFSSQLPGVNVGEPWLCSPPLRTCSAPWRSSRSWAGTSPRIALTTAQPAGQTGRVIRCAGAWTPGFITCTRRLGTRLIGWRGVSDTVQGPFLGTASFRHAPTPGAKHAIAPAICLAQIATACIAPASSATTPLWCRLLSK